MTCNGLTVYAVGEVDYDIRRALPDAIFATHEDAMDYVERTYVRTRKVRWKREGPAWMARIDTGTGAKLDLEVIIEAYVVGDAPAAPDG